MRAIDDFYAALGAAIRARREALELTQTALSEKVGLSRTSITNIERGRQRLLADQLQAVATSLDIATDELLPQPKRGQGGTTRATGAKLKRMPTVAKFVEDALADLNVSAS